MTSGIAAEAQVSGLSTAQVRDRRARGLINHSRPPIGRTYGDIVREHALPRINLALFSISLVLFAIGLPVDALVTAGPVLLNIVVGIVQEVRAKRELDRLAILHQPTAVVVREGSAHDLAAGDIVLGDVVMLRRGDQALVDGRIVSGAVELDESQLTGESDAMARGVGGRVTSGTACVSGQALYEVDRIGGETVAENLLAQARSAPRMRTPIQRTIDRAILTVAVVVLASTLLVGVTMLRSAPTWIEAAQAAAVLIALVPQGLLVVVTITYAMGAIAISRRGGLVQRVAAIESMSHVDTLCVDKTGTLTTGSMRLHGVDAIGRGVDEVRELAGAIAASLEPPTAVVHAVRADLPGQRRETALQVAFSSERGWSGLAFADSPARLYVLGAPDAILPAVDEPVAGHTAAQAGERAANGLRVLVLGVGEAPMAAPDGGLVPLPQRVEPLALIAVAEELRPRAADVMTRFLDAGVDVKVISGDDPRTLSAIAGAAGIDARAAPAGPSLAQLDEERLADTLRSATIFGRVAPQLKARFVGVLRAAGRHVAMLGDGVNDLVALRHAHLGIAMGSGSRATRTVADIVLLNDDFALLPSIITAGQRIVAAMVVTLELLLARTFYMVLIIAGTALFGLEFPFTPRNNSLLALITVGIPTLLLALVVAPVHPPRNLVRSTLRFVIPAGIGVALVALPVYAAALRWSGDPATARTVLVHFTVVCGLGLLTLLAVMRPTRPVARAGQRWRIWALAGGMALAYAAITFAAPLRGFFELAVPAPGLAAAIGLGVAWIVAAHVLARGILPRLVHRFEQALERRGGR